MKSTLETELADLKAKRRRIVRELEELDTRIIGLRLQLDKISAKERYQTEQEQSRSRATLFDED